MGKVSKDQLMAMMEMMKTMIESISDDDDADSETKPKTVRKTKSQKSTTKKSSPIQPKGVIVPDRPNLFDDMPEKDMHKSDSEVDKKLNKYPPTPRTRSYRPIDVCCRICGKKESISPSLAPEDISRYKCNKCCSSQG